MILRRLSRLALLTTGALALTGCAARFYYTSEVANRPLTWIGRPSDRAVTFNGRAVDVSVDAQNSVTSSLWFMIVPVYLRGPRPSYGRLPIWIEVTPRRRLLRFDPDKVAIVGVHGDTLHAMRWWGPGVADRACECGEPRSDARIDEDLPFPPSQVRYAKRFRATGSAQVRPDSGGVTVTRPTCFLMLFDGHRAGLDFTLLTARGVLDQDSGDIPAIRFRKKTNGWVTSAFGGPIEI